MSQDNVMNEPLVAYGVIERGISFEKFSRMKFLDILNQEEWGEILELTQRTLATYKKENKVFKSLQSEKIMEVNEVFTRGMEVFGNKEKFTSWLNRKNPLFNDLSPKELLRNSYGKEVVLSELNAIEHGVFA